MASWNLHSLHSFKTLLLAKERQYNKPHMWIPCQRLFGVLDAINASINDTNGRMAGKADLVPLQGKQNANSERLEVLKARVAVLESKEEKAYPVAMEAALMEKREARLVSL